MIFVDDRYQNPPDWTDDTLRGMMWAADVYMGRIIALLKQKQMYDHTLILYTADSECAVSLTHSCSDLLCVLWCEPDGGVDKSSNFPLRGEKVGSLLVFMTSAASPHQYRRAPLYA